MNVKHCGNFQKGLWRLPNVQHSEHQPWAQFRGMKNANDTLRGSEEQAFNTRLREEEKERPTHGAAAKDPQRLPPSGPLTPPKLRRQSLRSLPGQTKGKSALTSHPKATLTLTRQEGTLGLLPAQPPAPLGHPLTLPPGNLPEPMLLQKQACGPNRPVRVLSRLKNGHVTPTGQ